MKRENRFGAHVGTSSLLLIFMTLSLVSFAALSLASSGSDLRLSKKLLAHTKEYYTACHEAERFVAETDARLRRAFEQSDSAEAWFAFLGEEETQTEISMNGTQKLYVALQYVYPEPGAADGRLYRITSWRIDSGDDGSYSRHLPVSGSGGLPE